MFSPTTGPVESARPKLATARSIAAPVAKAPVPEKAAFLFSSAMRPGEFRQFVPAVLACRKLGISIELVLFRVDEQDDGQIHNLKSLATDLLNLDLTDAELPETPCGKGFVGRELSYSYQILEYLKKSDFDYVFSDQRKGSLHFSILRKEQKISPTFNPTMICILTEFALQDHLNNRKLLTDPGGLIRFQMETATVAACDFVVAPSKTFAQNAVEIGAISDVDEIFFLEREAREPDKRQASDVDYKYLLIPGCEPIRRNIHFLATTIRRNPEAFGFGDGARIVIDISNADASMRAFCRDQLDPLPNDWSFRSSDQNLNSRNAIIFLPFCDEFFELDDVLESLAEGMPALIGTDTTLAEFCSPNYDLLEAYPDNFAEALGQGLSGQRCVDTGIGGADVNSTQWRNIISAAATRRRTGGGASREKDVTEPLISICIMHFNRPGLVAYAIESALTQTYRNIEILLLDDGSDSREAREFLNQLPNRYDVKIKVVRQQNRYLGAARNAAAKAARGEYIFFLDDDNILKPDSIEIFLRAAQNSGAAFLGSFSDSFSGNEGPPPNGVPIKRIIQSGTDGGYSLFLNAIADGNCLCHREAFLNLGGNTEEYGIGKDDQEFFARAILNGNGVSIVPEALFWARRLGTRLQKLHFDWTAGYFRVLQAYWRIVPPRIRGLLLYAQGHFIDEHEKEAEKASNRSSPKTRSKPLSIKPAVKFAIRTQSFLSFSAECLIDVDQIANMVSIDDRKVDLIVRLNGKSILSEQIQFKKDSENNRESRFFISHGLGWLSHSQKLLTVHNRQTDDIIGSTVIPSWTDVRSNVTSLKGECEDNRFGNIEGWYLDVKNPDKKRTVAIYVDGRLYDVVRADLYREDIAKLHDISGYCGFRCELDDPIKLKSSADVEVRDALNGRVLYRGQLTVHGSHVRIRQQ